MIIRNSPYFKEVSCKELKEYSKEKKNKKIAATGRILKIESHTEESIEIEMELYDGKASFILTKSREHTSFVNGDTIRLFGEVRGDNVEIAFGYVLNLNIVHYFGLLRKERE